MSNEIDERGPLLKLLCLFFCRPPRWGQTQRRATEAHLDKSSRGTGFITWLVVYSVLAFFCSWLAVCTFDSVGRFTLLLKQGAAKSAAAVVKCENRWCLTAPRGECMGNSAPRVSHGHRKEKSDCLQSRFYAPNKAASVAFRLAMGHVALELQLKCEKQHIKRRLAHMLLQTPRSHKVPLIFNKSLKLSYFRYSK